MPIMQRAQILPMPLGVVVLCGQLSQLSGLGLISQKYHSNTIKYYSFTEKKASGLQCTHKTLMLLGGLPQSAGLQSTNIIKGIISLRTWEKT